MHASIRRRIPLGLLAIFVSGCTSLDLNLGRKEMESVRVKEVVCLWEPAEGVGLDGLPTRGFAGQMLFFKPGSPKPVRVDGDVRIYVFDDQGTSEEQTRPLHQFDFPSAAWQAFARDTNLGPAYQIFIPYTRKGRQFADCAVRVRFTAEDQLPVYSKLANISLAGRRSPVEPFDTTAASAQPAAHATSALLDPQQSFAESVSIPVPQTSQMARLRHAAEDAVQTADFVEEKVIIDEQLDAAPLSPRRYRMSGAIQQASASTE